MNRTGFPLPAWLHALAMALVVATTLAPTVAAHARLSRSEPAADAVVAAAPAMVKLWFTEELKTVGTTAEVVDAQGRRVDRGDAKVDLNDPDRKLVLLSLQASLPHGTYTVRWTSVSAEDGDTERGEFQFHVGERSAPPPAPAAPSAAEPRDHGHERPAATEEHSHEAPAAETEHGHEARATPRQLPRAGGAPLDAALLAGLALAGAGLALRRVARR